MALIFDYLDWRGDVPFSVSPFNEIDNYIISKIGTPDYTGLLPRSMTEIPIRDLCDRYFGVYGEEGRYLGLLASPRINPMIKRLPDTVRFGELKLSGFVSKIIPSETEQFSALTVTLPDGTRYVSFRGTDDNLIAWKENLLIAVRETVAAQADALDYLIRAASELDGPIIVGGHSKGGNLAVYAAANAPKEIQDRIICVYNNDGPGFRQEFLATEGYRAIRSRVQTLLPQHSIVGTLLTQDEGFIIVRSTKSGIGAHDGFNWETTPKGFVRCPKLSRGSRAFEESMTTVLEKMDDEERLDFIEELFEVLGATGAVTLTDLTDHKLSSAITIVNSLRKGSKTKKFIVEIIEKTLKEFSQIRNN
ncbi:MAG: DUF2974 domain-containing protein [Oscillospiraceae bacterium]|nr:DUF2974 domain-containing protein [Oscillospiraceae bacterium]